MNSILQDANIPSWSTLADILRWRALYEPEKQAYTFLLDGETHEARWTYAELDASARRIAFLLEGKTTPGDRVLLLYQPGLEYIAAIFGCWYAGVVAVPAYPPRLNHNLTRIEAIIKDIQDAQATVAVTTSTILSSLRRKFANNPSIQRLQWLETDMATENRAASRLEWHGEKEHLALLQYTSGSTGIPKGVMLTHDNLLKNAQLIQESMGLNAEMRIGNWLPPYHDMGLMGGILEALYVGAPAILMAPAAFLQQPLRWLRMISHYNVQVSCAPNFAYDLCVWKATPEQLVDLDLSCWQVALSGAEPVRAETLERFAATFAPYGFRKEGFYPSYGLAEATLFVSGGKAQALPQVHTFDVPALETGRVLETTAGDKQHRPFVGCGYAREGQQIVIVDPERQTKCASDQVGEIWVASPNVAQGYWSKSEETQQTFHAYLQGSGEGPFLRTGDLGFFWQGELFITGRLKDVIIIRGRNLSPQDIEQVVEKSHPALRQGCCAAFAVPGDSTEGLVVVQEVERHYEKWDLQHIVRLICQAVISEFEVEVAGVVLLRAGTIYKTSSGKIQRQKCRAHFLDGNLPSVYQWKQTQDVKPPQIAESPSMPAHDVFATYEAIVAWLTFQIATQAQLEAEQIDIHAPLVLYGLDSLAAVGLSDTLGQRLGRSLSPTLVYDYPSIDALARHLSSPEDLSERTETSEEPIAIIGMSCCFPGAPNLDAFWQLLATGTDAIQEVPSGRWNKNPLAMSDEEFARVSRGGFIEHAELFDAHFFGLSAHEVKYMDPQQRILLEVAWEALEHAGLVPGELSGTETGVFIGIGNNDYGRLLFRELVASPLSSTGNSFSIAANRLSYLLDLKGPSMAVDAACASALVAVHMACQSLRSGEASMALAGGVNLLLAPEITQTLTDAQMIAADGYCKTFDSRADGYVRSEGCGVIVLQRLSEAQRSGHRVLAIIRGSAVNHNGHSNGLTAPNGLSQQAVIRQALRAAHVEPAQISYVEAHGTGTPLGDPIEVQALNAVLGEGRSSNEPCLLGSVKTNIGHLEAAAGIAGIIKVVLALQQQQIPPHLHLETVNPHIPLQQTCLRIPTTLSPWTTGEEKRLAGVSAFGFGGTNAHAILEEGPQPVPVSESQPTQRARLLVLSTKTSSALETATTQLADYLQQNPEINLADVASTLQRGRTHFRYRRFLVSGTREEALVALTTPSSGLLLSGQQGVTSPQIVFMFPGIGSHYVGMAHEMYLAEPVFRFEVDHCVTVLQSHLELDLRTLLYPEPGQETYAQAALMRPAIGYPALFVISYAYAQLWMSWGITPDAMIGHSLGEYVAACLSGVLSLEDALAAVAVRARLFETLSAGAMLGVALSEEQVQPFLGTQLSLAVVNSPTLCVVSGPADAIEQLTIQLHELHIETWKVHIAMAAHSLLVEPILADFLSFLQTLEFHAPTIPYISNVTGDWITEEQATNPHYWLKHTRQTVRFADGLQTIIQKLHPVLLEVGPGQTLSTFAKQGRESVSTIFSSLPHRREQRSAHAFGLQTLGRLWLLGVNVTWDNLYARDTIRPRLVALPTYPFERQDYHMDFHQVQTPDARSLTTRNAQRADLHDWFYAPVWKRQETYASARVQKQVPQNWLVFIDESVIGKMLVRQLEEDGHTVITVQPADQFRQVDEHSYTLHPQRRADYDELLQTLLVQESIPQKVVHAWTIMPPATRTDSPFEQFDQAQALGLYSMLFLIQALGEWQQTTLIEIIIIVGSTHVVTGDEEMLYPERATIVGLCRTIPYSYTNITCRCIDVVVPASQPQLARVGGQLRRELVTETTETLVAYRGAFRWTQTIESITIPRQQTQALPLREKGVYLITGGLGGIGLELAKCLNQTVQATLILLGHSALPERDQWAECVLRDDETAHRIQTILALEAGGSEVMVVQADVADLERMRIVLQQVEDRFGILHGVIHTAGIAGKTASIDTLTVAETQRVLSAKVYGALILQKLLGERERDFLVFCSSLSSWFNAAVSLDYSVANTFLDALAHSIAASAQTTQLTLSINWDLWSEIGMGMYTLMNNKAMGAETPSTPSHQVLKDKISPQEGQEAFLYLLGSGRSQVFVTPKSWKEHTELSVLLKKSSLQSDEPVSQTSSIFTTRPDLITPYVAPRTSLEELIVSIWQDVLGFALLGVDDNLFDLGGDSILGIQIIARAQRKGLQITAQQLFQNQTVALLAEVVAETLAVSSNQSETTDNLEQALGQAPIIAPQLEPQTARRLPSDFPLVHLTQAELESLLSKYPQIEDLYPLTPLQQGMLLHTLREPGSGTYIEQLICTILELRQPLFVEAIQYVIERCSILRTAFAWQDGEEPLQVVAQQVDLPIMILDWCDRSQEEQERDLAALIQEDRVRGFDLQQAPVTRLAFIHMSDVRTLVLWSYHQILLDGWSIEQLLSDVFVCYLALMQKQVPQLPSRRPYRDYLAWLQTRPQHEDAIYWQQYLAGFHSPTPLSIDSLSPERVQEPTETRYSTEALTIPAVISSRWQEAAQHYRVTLNTLMLGAWMLLLSRYSGQEDVLCGTVVSGRPPQLPGMEHMIGLFINSLPVRVQIQEKQGVKDWLMQLQSQQVERQQHEHCALLQVQGWSEIPRNLPLFESVFVFENYPIEDKIRLQGQHLNIEKVEINSQTNYPLTIFVVIGKELQLHVNYDRQRFDRATIQRLLSHLQIVIEQFASQPDLLLADTSLLTAQERQQLLTGWHAGSKSGIEGIHTLFETQVEAAPDAVAVVCDEQTLTYAELNRRANQLAHYLQGRGVRPEVRVGVLLERSLWLPVVLLGILKAGGAYVPLDPALPSARLSMMAQDADVTLLVSSSTLLPVYADSVGTIVSNALLIEQVWQRLDAEQADNLNALVAESNLAYIVYTSGSTGRPKGVLSTHAGVLNYLRFILRAYGLTSDITVLQIPPISFDASVRDIFATLSVGGRLVLMKEHETKDLRLLITKMQHQRVTALLSVVPSFVRTLLETADSMQQTCPTVQLVLASGERLPLEVVGSLRRIFGAQVQVVNQYGPTETTMTSTYYCVEQQLGERGFAPIGRPIEQMQAYVLDQRLHLVPVGVTGEVYLAGSGLARGYVGQAGVTAECFVPNPFSQTTGARIYRTGDLARYRPDGVLEYIGRRDQQIKVRGNRVELGEIIATLEEYPGVGQAIVVSQEIEPSLDKQLLAYIVPEQRKMPSVKDLRTFLQARLPEYMLPTHFIPLETIPLTPNGKVDRRALPLPAQEEQPDLIEEELTPLQARVASIWTEMLHRPHITLQDDFFELGGHSLLALQLINRVRTTFAVDLPLDSLFETPTVAQMVILIEEMQEEMQEEVLEQATEAQLAQLLDSVEGLSEDEIEHLLRDEKSLSLQIVPQKRVSDELALSFAQERLWFLDQFEPFSTAYTIPSVQRLRGTLSLEALQRSFSAVVQRHETLRTTFVSHEGHPVQVIVPSLPLTVPIIDLRNNGRGQQEATVERIVQQEILRPFQLTVGPLVRAHLLWLDTQDYVLILVMHHIISDSWSIGVLWRELSTLYSSYVSGKVFPLTPLPIQYADYALWQRRWLQGEVIETQLAYWKQQLAEITPLRLPIDHQRSVQKSHRGATYTFLLATDLVKTLVDLSSQEQVTLFMTSLAVFQTLLHRITGQDDIAVGTDITGRQRVELEGLIGFFVNQLVLRADLSKKPTFREFLRQVRATALEAYVHQDLPFEQLVAALHPLRSGLSAPLFQVKFLLDKSFDLTFNTQNVPLVPGVMVSQEGLPPAASKDEDLQLSLLEVPEGLVGTFVYNADLFDAVTIERMAQRFVRLVESICADPDTRIDRLKMLNKKEEEKEVMEQNKNMNTAFSQLKMVQRKPVRLQQEPLIQKSFLSAKEHLPLVISPETVALDIAEWAKSNQSFIEAELHKHGALLFRGFSVSSPADFERFALILCSDLFQENGEHVPANIGDGNLYTPVFYAPEKKLLWHNENSFNDTWPQKIMFFCTQPAAKGGETPIADNRRVFQRIDPAIRERFMQKGIMYIRNYGEGLGLPWQKVFRTEKKEEVERYCQKADIAFEWKDDKHLKTRMIRPAVLKHPQTGEWIWWNQAAHWHPACLEKEVRDSLLTLFGEDDLPRNCFYGDGSPIKDAVIDAICDAYQEAEVSFPWRQGDILVLDNMLTAHARNPYEGPRKIYVSMGNMITLNDISQENSKKSK